MGFPIEVHVLHTYIYCMYVKRWAERVGVMLHCHMYEMEID